MKPADVNSRFYINFNTEILIKIINSKLMIMYECQDMKIFLQKDTNQIGQKKFFVIKDVKNNVPGHLQ